MGAEPQALRARVHQHELSLAHGSAVSLPGQDMLEQVVSEGRSRFDSPFQNCPSFTRDDKAWGQLYFIQSIQCELNSQQVI